MATRKEVYDAVDNVKEYLALNKWNEAMMLMAQISIEVIENLTDEALIVSKGYEEDLKTLLTGGFINDATAHNLETLIISGVQAHNGVDIPSDYVKKALTVLEDELKVVYDNNDINVSTTDSQKEMAMSNAEKVKEPSFVYDEDENVKRGYEDEDEPAFINKDGDVDFRVKEKLRRESFNNVPIKVGKRKITKLIAIIIPIILIIVIAILIRSCVKNNRDDIRNAETYSFATSEEAVVDTTENTEPTDPPEAGMWNVMGDVVWIRDQANTTSSKKLARVDKGDQVRVIQIIDGVDRKWAIINYDGKEAFIARDYIDPTDEVRQAMRRVEAERATVEETSDAPVEQ